MSWCFVVSVSSRVAVAFCCCQLPDSYVISLFGLDVWLLDPHNDKQAWRRLFLLSRTLNFTDPTCFQLYGRFLRLIFSRNIWVKYFSGAAKSVLQGIFSGNFSPKFYSGNISQKSATRAIFLSKILLGQYLSLLSCPVALSVVVLDVTPTAAAADTSYFCWCDLCDAVVFVQQGTHNLNTTTHPYK